MVRVRVWLFGAGGLIALLCAYAGGRVGTHEWCVGGDAAPVYCEHTNGHHSVYLALGWAFFAFAVLLFALAWQAKTRPKHSAAEPTM